MTDGEFKRILLPQYRQMYTTAFAILRDPDDASDAVQDTISTLWQKHEGMAIPENVSAFCNRTIRNLLSILQNSRQSIRLCQIRRKLSLLLRNHNSYPELLVPFDDTGKSIDLNFPVKSDYRVIIEGIADNGDIIIETN